MRSRWLLPLLACSFLPLPARAQDDSGWAQFTRENTVRGAVTSSLPGAKGNGAFEVKTDDGQPWRILYGPNTKFIHDRQPAKPEDVHTGDMLFVAGNVDTKKHQVGAALLVDIDAAEVQKAKEGLGKTWCAGKVTAVDGTRLTVHRLDGVDQTIAVDENTEFRRRQEPVTLADIHPGGGIRADGRLVQGVFTATVVHLVPIGREPWFQSSPGKPAGAAPAAPDDATHSPADTSRQDGSHGPQ
jgi:hypothetical protein